MAILLEKPFASCLADADIMIQAMRETGKLFAVNWPLAWYPPHVTAKRLVDEGAIGKVIEVHFYDGNRGPLFHTSDKVELTAEEREREKPLTWFYKRAAGGGSLLDYLGYGATLGTWYHGGKAPLEVTSVVDEPARPGSGRAQHHGCPVRLRPVPFRDALGHALRPVDPPAAAQVRIRHRREKREHLQLRFREDRAPPDRSRISRWPRHSRGLPAGPAAEPRPILHPLPGGWRAGAGASFPRESAARVSGSWTLPRSAPRTSTPSGSCRGRKKTMLQEKDDSYGLAPQSSREERPAPALPYRPADPVSYRPRIGLIGCGGISIQHLRAYRDAGYEVAMLCDRQESKAADARSRFYPDAGVTTDFRDVLKRDDIEVVDLAAHPQNRAPMYGPCIEAGKHILSQKPFVTDLDFGLRVIEQAEKKGVRLAVNQNGRWAPHWSWMRSAISAGLLGDISSVRTAVNWDHTWVAGTVFENIHSLILYDFGIHWFDIVSCFMAGRRPVRVSASAARSSFQQGKPPFLSQAFMEYEDAPGRPVL